MKTFKKKIIKFKGFKNYKQKKDKDLIKLLIVTLK